MELKSYEKTIDRMVIFTAHGPVRYEVDNIYDARASALKILRESGREKITVVLGYVGDNGIVPVESWVAHFNWRGKPTFAVLDSDNEHWLIPSNLTAFELAGFDMDTVLAGSGGDAGGHS
jgi:hypothetical protein